MPNFRSILLVLLCFISVSSFSQSKNTEKADDLFRSEAYITALESYRDAYQKESSNKVKAYVVFQIAECFRHVNDIENSKKWYLRSIQLKHTNPKQYLYLGMAFMQQADYATAQKHIKDYLSQTTGDKVAKNLLQSCKIADSWMANPTKWKVKNQKAINSPEHDFAPAFADKRNSIVMYTSGRKGSSGDNLDDRIGENFQDLWAAEKDRKGVWSEPYLFNPTINTEDAHEGSATLNYKRNTIYYTQCKVDKKEKLGCNIVTADFIGSDLRNVRDMVELKMGKGDSISVGHPAISKRGDFMVFSADLPGGLGGRDLWVTNYDKKAKSWSTPKNLGPKINTSANEVYPFIHPNGDLYFSSNGLVGLGGLDLYKASSISDGRWENPENMKAPLNSPKDDFGMVFNKDNPEGFFTSNRNGGLGKDDIYSFVYPPAKIILEGKVLDRESGRPVSDVGITVKNAYGISFTLNTDSEGNYKFDANGSARYLQSGQEYIIEVMKQDYLVARDQFSTAGINDDKTFRKDFVIKYAPINKPVSMPEVRYNFNSYTLTKQAQDSLGFLFDILDENPNITIELQAHTDSRGDDEENLILSQRRAESCVTYLIERGIDPARMKAKGYGEKELKVSDEQIENMANDEQREIGHQVNRRTVFMITSFDFGK
tara:strand:- start:13865 stop:15832 length:1968 start_codon:yes stop_codon:yes gene_type:complete